MWLASEPDFLGFKYSQLEQNTLGDFDADF